MQNDGEKDFKLWEWVVLFGLAVLAIAVTEIVGLSQKWQDVVVFTIVLFAVVLLVLRQFWRKPALWRNLLPLFVLHVTAFVILAQSLPLGRFGFPKLPLILGGMAEGILIIAVLWKRVGDGMSRSKC